jgi:DNA-binding transcriptional LysR family regulator
MQLRFLEYFIALAEEKHFGRAAQRCNVTQPTLSGGIAGLETALGKRLVLRDRRFLGLTADGLVVLPQARFLVAAHEDMRRSVDSVGPLRGELRLGVIPAVMPCVGRFIEALRLAHPDLRVSLCQLTSSAIQQGIEAFELDAGLTYVEPESTPSMRQVPFYREYFRFAARADSELGKATGVTLAQAASQPMALLHAGMQNRRILDRHLQRLGIAINPVVTADSYIALLSMVAQGGLASIVTDSHAAFLDPACGVRLIPIIDVEQPNSVGLLVPDGPLLSPVAQAAVQAVQTLVDD